MKRNSYYIFLVLFIFSACSSRTPLQVATATQEPRETSIPTITIKPTSTTEISENDAIKVNNYFPIERKESLYENYSSINLEQITNGDLLKSEREYLQTHILFINGESIPATKLYKQSSPVRGIMQGWSVTVNNLDFPINNEYSSNSDTRPIKIFSYYPFVDIDLFKELGLEKEYSKRGLTGEQFSEEFTKNPRFWVISWGYLNPDRTIAIGHTLLSIGSLESRIKIAKEHFPNSDFKFVPAYSLENVIFTQDERVNLINEYLFLERLFEKYPQFKPDEQTINNWANSGYMSPDLEIKIFTLQGQIFVW